ncbi:MAG: hypothetical protein K2X38_06040 [Gemmataceae bacterium]|nr:hypothetical protein [Gemmataceae bacterium]
MSSHEKSFPKAAGTSAISDPSQLDFEIGFYFGVLQRRPDYIDVLRVLGNNLSLLGRYPEGLTIDRRLVRLRPDDPYAHYNLACSYALLRKKDLAFRALGKAIQRGYSDLRYMREDQDLESIRHDPRFRQMLRDLEAALLSC